MQILMGTNPNPNPNSILSVYDSKSAVRILPEKMMISNYSHWVIFTSICGHNQIDF